ncbi:carbon-phosphorus lyase complex subunit [Magnetospirillum gryphiswaldense]|uniref:Phosphonate metabolism protein n=1 Tax=Magnetospirillum gryphiswaldense TaxID=55518 RepID=A4U4I0_9PROT|nr:carbon-phosphorus lyase complex subunit PhnI [Magnetospirillum gryphiswaldense]AVM72616.1 Alpha-D-ribose 1-methylphosphonate 5-triphosphate synthase subunit PhnI [Magnetospirillum gryphiswaldense MSR-1]AVM76519.1 Alpha-D-ribose 1-methylphosphonate 5-triphosphate synthase subunit PhnI [Magnetospirillum gryphiswaldense]CAM77787.1 Phosphonate metabolism protein [Magnetospirillum gryphiswaldense MSR-1]
MYVAVKGGEKAIDNAHALLAEDRRGDEAIPELTLAQIEQQLGLAVDRVMTEGSVYDRDLAALALKQAQGDAVEAIFLLRAYRTTLPRFGASLPVETGAMAIRRRISAAFKDLPGGQVLGPTYDYTHRLLDFALAAEGAPRPTVERAETGLEPAPRVTDVLHRQGLIEPSGTGADIPGDLTRQPLNFPAGRDLRLQNLARGDEGFILALAYSSQRGYGNTHPFAGEIRMGEVAVELVPEELGFAIDIGTITVTECQMINQFKGSKDIPPQFTRGYGLTFGQGERKAMAMALVDRSLRAEDLGEQATNPAQDQEFVLYHSDNVEASGFVQHLKLPHYVDFQSELEMIRRLRRENAEAAQ